MTLAEFKAWLEGFEHSFLPSARSDIQTAAPSPEQWLAIKEKLALVDTKPVFIPQVGERLPGQKTNDWYRQGCQQSYNDQAQLQQAQGAGLSDLIKKAG